MNDRKGIESLIFIDGGDPVETAEAKKLLGFIDGQTTNPSLVAKNPEIKKFIESGKRFSKEDLLKEYKTLIQAISKATDGPTSIEVDAREDSTVEDLMEQAHEMNTWIPNGYIKFPTIKAGVQAAHQSVAEGIRVNMTLCFSQDQAAAVYAATKNSQSKPLPGYFDDRSPVYISPFVGRLDDIGQNGMDLIANILSMYHQLGDGHVHVLSASIRNLHHLMYALKLKSEAITMPFSVFKEWAEAEFKLPTDEFIYDPKFDLGKELETIPYKELTLDEEWNNFDIKHELTQKGLVKFGEDWQSLLKND